MLNGLVWYGWSENLESKLVISMAHAIAACSWLSVTACCHIRRTGTIPMQEAPVREVDSDLWVSVLNLTYLLHILDQQGGLKCDRLSAFGLGQRQRRLVAPGLAWQAHLVLGPGW
jgi:hypothetical protein